MPAPETPGVETLPAFRRRGFGAEVTAAWGREVFRHDCGGLVGLGKPCGPGATAPVSLRWRLGEGIVQSGWRCGQCGPLGEPELSIYREELFNTQSRRFGPWCTRCGARALYRGDRRVTAGAVGANGRPRVIVLSGTCASGKSTVSYEMSTRHDFTQIDGDWILDLRKKELGHRPELTEIDGEMLGMAEGMVALGRSVVIAHVVLPATFGYYHDYLGERGIEHRIVVLMPRERVVLDRNRERKCWPKTTPEYWVQKFRRDFLDAGEAITGYLYDNSDEAPAETAARLAGSWEAERGTKEEP